MNELGYVLIAAFAAAFVFLPRLGAFRVLRQDPHELQKALLNERLDDIGRNAEDSQQASLAVEIAEDLLGPNARRGEIGSVSEANEGQIDALKSQERAADVSVGRSVAPSYLPVSSLTVLLAAILLLGGGLFVSLVDFERRGLRGAESVLALDAKEDEAEILAWQVRLKAYAAGHPDDGQIQFLLGQAYLKTTDYAAAAEAFAQAHEASPGDPTVQVFWLQARFLAARGLLDDAGRELAKTILEGTPNVPVVLEILAMDAVAQGEPASAVGYLNRAVAGYQDPARIAGLSAAIGELRKQFELPGVTVDVSAKGQPPANGTVYVIARPIGGGMPFAVVRRPAFLLPLSLRLDDMVSMSEARTLSSADAFEIVVRLSLTGQPMAGPGDWEWVSESIYAESQAEPISAILRQPD
jgi:cytochrome c-type biogenesis protein CcmH